MNYRTFITIRYLIKDDVWKLKQAKWCSTTYLYFSDSYTTQLNQSSYFLK
jgi:hypothetical protein